MKPSDVKKAVILAAGLGTRLDPLTRVVPKPLLPVQGVPAVERIVRLLERWGVREIAVNAHHLAAAVARYADERNKTGVAKITVSVEKEILGTGGALRPLEAFLGNDPFWFVNGDIVAESLDPVPLVEAFERSGSFASCWLVEGSGPQTVEADPEGRVCCWRSPTPGVRGTYTYAGFALLGADVRRHLPGAPFCTIVDAYENAMLAEERFVRGVVEKQAWWNDFGTLDRYLETHLALDPEGFENFPNVLMPGTRLETDAELAGCVVTGGLVGGRLVHCAAVHLSALGDRRLCAIAEALGWKPDDTAAVLLGKRGSAREFWRLVRGAQRAIAVSYDDSERAENARYVSHAHVLEDAGIRVPKVLADIPELKISAFEDLGDDSLQSRFDGTEKPEKGAAERDYRAVAEWLAGFHSRGLDAARAAGAELEEPFGPDLFAFEHSLFEDRYVKERLGLEDGLPDAVRAELGHAASLLDRAPKVLVHRDFQSSNIFFAPDGETAVIDFQGMREGPAAYDLASLVYDPYVSLSKAERNAAAAAYAKTAAGGAETAALLPQAGVQRLVQALGAYARLVSAGQRGFARHILPALSLLHGLAHEAALPGLASFTHLLMERERLMPE